MTLSIAPIGSCRIVDPLRRARGAFGFEMNRGRSLGFTHSSPEAVQQLRFMRGEIDIPADLWPYVSNVDRQEAMAQQHQPSDIYVVELSSEKILSVGDTLLQLNYLRTQFVPFFSDNTRKNAYWKAIQNLGQDEIDAFLKEAWSGTPEKDAESAQLRRIRMRRATEEQTRQDMRYLADALPNVMFVTHVNALEKTGTVIKTRDRFIKMVKDIAAEEGLRVFDPTDRMTEVGQADALEPDLNHYTDTFKDEIVKSWFDAHLSALVAGIKSKALAS